MRDRARVQSTQALLEAKAAIIEFIEVVKSTLASVESDINRVDQWVNSQQPAHWKHEVRKREEAVQRCKLEIERKRLIQAPEPASVVFEQKMLARAKVHLDQAKVRQEATRRWAIAFEKQAFMAKSGTRALQDAIQVHLPQSIALLERMVSSLESYAAIRHEPAVPNDVIMPHQDAEPEEAGSPQPETPS